MTAIACYAARCIFNHSRQRCGAGKISVAAHEAGVYCGTYRNRDGYLLETDEDSLEMINMQMVSDPAVQCQAETCFYNQGNVCYAAAIEMLGEDAVNTTETRCKTYLPLSDDCSSVDDVSQLGAHMD
ncbi:MAG: DUF1540 domain-containing protein [Syntrophomonadaceae bacterium]|jgi:hypothetical protein